MHSSAANTTMTELFEYSGSIACFWSEKYVCVYAYNVCVHVNSTYKAMSDPVFFL